MSTDHQPDKNDVALAQYFLRGMQRFEKHVQAQDMVDTVAETLAAWIEAAYFLARLQFKPVKEDQ